MKSVSPLLAASLLYASFATPFRASSPGAVEGKAGQQQPSTAPLSGAQPSSAKPTEHLIGTITAVDNAAHSITLKEDKTGVETTVLLAGTRTLIKVAPGAKDLKSATRITADELAVGDRVDIRGNKPPDDPSKVAARSVVLMSGRDLQAARQAQAAEWQNSSAGVVTAIDPASGKIEIRQRTPAGPKPVTIETSANTEFTRYSPEQPDTPQSSHLDQIQPADQVRVIGDAGADGTKIVAKRVYSGAFRTVSGTVLSLAPDGKSLTIRELASKQSREVRLTGSSSIQKMPPEMAARMAQRMQGAGAPRGSPPGASPGSDAAAANGAAPGGEPGAPRPAARNGDISRLLDRLPRISPADLKPGDAVVVAGALSSPEPASPLLATHVIAGVEPLLQATPATGRGGRNGGGGGGGQNLGGDWGLGDIAIPQ